MIHPGSVVSKPATKKYRDNWERTFGKKSAAAKARRIFEKHLRDHRKALESDAREFARIVGHP